MTILYKKGDEGIRRLYSSDELNVHLIGEFNGRNVRWAAEIAPYFLNPDDELIVRFTDAQLKQDSKFLRREEINQLHEILGITSIVTAKGFLNRTDVELKVLWEPTLPPGARK